MSRPICVHCGAVYGTREARTEVIKYPEGDKEPPYRGNGRVVKSRSWRTQTSRGSTGGFGYAPVTYGPGEVVVTREVWDGESWWGGCPPFCTNRCAIDFAHKAYRAGFRSEKRK